MSFAHLAPRMQWHFVSYESSMTSTAADDGSAVCKVIRPYIKQNKDR